MAIRFPQRWQTYAEGPLRETRPARTSCPEDWLRFARLQRPLVLVVEVPAGDNKGLVGKGVGDGTGDMLGCGAGEIPGVGTGAMPGLGAGFTAGVGPGETPGVAAVLAGCAPDGIPGAAGRDPSWLAPVPSGRLAAGPPVDGPSWDGFFC